MGLIENFPLYTPSIETAHSFETAIPIISEKLCDRAMVELAWQFLQRVKEPHLASIIPIYYGGRDVGEELAGVFGVKTNPMRMKKYGEDEAPLEIAECVIEPNLDKIIVDGHTLPVFFTEAVVETQDTILRSIEVINKLIDERIKDTNKHIDYPVYYTLALVSKTGHNPVLIPNLIKMFDVHPQIWVFGRGCDLGGIVESRKLRTIKGIKSHFYKQPISEPYFQPLFNVKN